MAAMAEPVPAALPSSGDEPVSEISCPDEMGRVVDPFRGFDLGPDYFHVTPAHNRWEVFSW
jgi:hypothetical protein